MIALNLKPLIVLNPSHFQQLCAANPDTKLELNAQGDLIIMSPTGGESGIRNQKLTMRLGIWSEENGTGVAFDSSTMFQLPNGALRSPDAAWIQSSRWNALAKSNREGFPPICPDFVVELRSQSDSLASLQAKMCEYRENGVSLGWLIDPFAKQVEIYRINQPKEVLVNPTALSGEDILPNLRLSLQGIID
jgi:Uma2 family endonuclease